ncbi:hypothetical protein B6A42_02510 [Vibrio coralliilyticus]|uniref:Uncharacterized protein n=1 Tax=Vibrio coralliilyticus TaxID=190893 RepID=A0AAP6ZUP1_9VIBR|nr:hypothetical protein [Vibrio coralliilyticus]ARC91247.1 hypothetical protein B6A42_02510 [Vibrio coralliilyticus]NOJ25472.1 hypothetical protein [Vibrio coralliilyticus]
MQVSDPIHLPCPDMAGMVDPNPEKLKRSRFLLQKLREKHGLNKPKPKRQLNVNALEWGNQ